MTFYALMLYGLGMEWDWDWERFRLHPWEGNFLGRIARCFGIRMYLSHENNADLVS
jgi:hypothetical protein